MSLGRVNLNPDSGQSVNAWLDGPCVPTGSGYGGWTVAARDGQKGIVEYAGVEPVRYTLPLLLDGWADDDPKQAEFDAILAMAATRGDKPPPKVIVDGPVPPHVLGTKDNPIHWYIESVAPGSRTLINDKGLLLRQDVVLTLLEPVNPKFTLRPVPRAQAAAVIGGGHSGALSGGLAHPAYAVAHTGDTLLTIAARYHKDWHALAGLNDIRDSKKKLTAGRRIRIS